MTNIVSCNGSDAPELLQLMNEFFPYIDADFASVLDRLHDENFTFLKFEHEENFFGYIEFEMMEETPSTVRLNAIAVRKELHGQGIGKELMHAGIAAMEKKGFEKIFLLVGVENAPAKKMYTKLGFTFLGLHPQKIAGKEVEEWEYFLAKKELDYVR